MNSWSIVTAAAAFLAAVSVSHAEQMSYPDTQEAAEAEILNMPWEFESGSYVLAKSNSSLQMPEDLRLLRGEAAERLMFLIEGTEFPETEAVVVDFETLAEVVFEYLDVGYVTLDDWEELDPDEFLEQIIETTEEDNIERRELGLLELHVKGWLVEPTLDRPNNSVSWAIESVVSGEPVVNAISLKLGRKGYERLTWVGTFSQYFGSDDLMEAMLDGYTYDPGYRYADYSIGDNLAGFGIAALVAVTAGATSKAGKGIFAVILAFLTKFIWIPIIVAAGAVWAGARRLFGAKRTVRTGPEDHRPNGDPPGG